MEDFGVCPICKGTLKEDSGEYGYKCNQCDFPYGALECSGGSCGIKFTEED